MYILFNKLKKLSINREQLKKKTFHISGRNKAFILYINVSFFDNWLSRKLLLNTQWVKSKMKETKDKNMVKKPRMNVCAEWTLEKCQCVNSRCSSILICNKICTNCCQLLQRVTLPLQLHECFSFIGLSSQSTFMERIRKTLERGGEKLKRDRICKSLSWGSWSKQFKCAHNVGELLHVIHTIQSKEWIIRGPVISVGKKNKKNKKHIHLSNVKAASWIHVLAFSMSSSVCSMVTTTLMLRTWGITDICCLTLLCTL